MYTWQGVLFALASFEVMCGITAALIWATKKLWILDLLLYGKSPRKELQKETRDGLKRNSEK